MDGRRLDGWVDSWYAHWYVATYIVDCVIHRFASMVWVCVLVCRWLTGKACWGFGCSASSYYNSLSQEKPSELRKR